MLPSFLMYSLVFSFWLVFVGSIIPCLILLPIVLLSMKNIKNVASTSQSNIWDNLLFKIIIPIAVFFSFSITDYFLSGKERIFLNSIIKVVNNSLGAIIFCMFIYFLLIILRMQLVPLFDKFFSTHFIVKKSLQDTINEGKSEIIIRISTVSFYLAFLYMMFTYKSI